MSLLFWFPRDNNCDPVTLLTRLGRALLCFVLTFSAELCLAAPAQAQLLRDMRAFSTMVGQSSVSAPPLFSGEHGSLMQRALAADAFRELNIAIWQPRPLGAEAHQTLVEYVEILRLLIVRYDRLFKVQPKKYGLENLRFMELQVISNINTFKIRDLSGDTSKEIEEQHQKMRASGNLQLGNFAGASLKQVATHISTGAYVGEAKTAGQAFLTRYLVELKDILTEAQQAEIKQLSGLS